ncbi:MAG: hypothetical protein K5945_03260, partial [Bacteroidaceae bacterium]|nr:hypothetical protein [Bacteroidaceae bacterium]
QQEVVAWDSQVWTCGMGEGEYPTFAAPAGLQIVDGYYLVSDADQLNQVNEKLLGGESNINVRLTADIDLSKSATPNLMIGSENAPFTGIFDGQGHAVTYAYTDVPGHCGFFKYLKDATVRDLYVKGTAVVNGIHYGALFSHGIGNLLIENVVTDVDITGTSNTGVQGDGGMSGYLEGKVTFNNCATLGTMGNAGTSMYCGFVAYATDAASSTLNNCYTACSLTEGTGTGYCFTFCRGSYVANNCYYLNAIGEVQGIQTTEEQIKSGALCYLLNGDQSKIQWTQTLITDLVPQPGTRSQQVFATGALLCDGSEIPNSPLVYTNTEGTPEIPAHQFGDDGFCTVCGNMKQNEAGYYLVGNADQFIRFAEKVAAGKTDMNVLLTGDIDLSKSGNVWVGDVTNSYKGTFDGAGHTITYNFNSTVDKWSGLFAHITGATIRNLYVTGEAVVTGIHYGALIGVAYGDVLVENVITNVKITGQRSGVTGDGGMLGANYAKITFNNCATLGAFGNPGSSMYSSFSAWSNGSSATTLNNCFTACALTDGTGTGNCFTLTHTSGNVTINNCYYLNEVGKVQGTPYAEDQIASGALCYMLNGDQSNITWYQKIGEDHIPTPNPSRGTVYKTGETTYANVDMTIPAVIDGVVQIATGKDLRGFAEMVNSGQNHLSAVLTADIDYGTDNTMIGVSDTEAGAYRGCFDGQGHSITINMTASGNYQTLFKYLGGEGVIKNVWVKGTITSNYKFISALAGDTHGSIQNCVAEVTFNSGISGDGTHGGLVGRSMNGSNIVNCLIKTKMNAPSTSMSGGIAGWMNGKSSFENCLVINEWTLDESGCFTVGRNAAAQLGRAYNVFYVNKLGDATGGTQITAADVKSGKACFLLNTDQSNIQWTQNIGDDDFPVPFKTRKQVYCSLNTKCDGTLAPQDKLGEVEEAYSNSQMDGVPAKHELHAGFCATCVGVNNKVDGITTNNVSCKNTAYKGYWDPYFIERDSAGYFMVKTVDDMLWLAYTEPMYNEFSHIKLMNDIDYSAEGWWLNTANWYAGVIDGQGHKLTIDIAGGGELTALIPNLGGDVKNLWIDGKISSSRTFAGSIFGETRNDGTRGNGHATMTNIISTVEITNTKSGDATSGGLGGRATNECYLTNCIFAGKMEASGSEMNGGLIGWSDATTHLSNCIQIGTYNTGANGSNTVSRNPGKLAIDGPVYYLNALGDTPSGATKIGSSDDIASGALTYLANGDQSKIVWFQTLKKDQFPVPFSDHAQVYAQPSWGYGCDAQPLGDVIYTNEFQQVVIPDHQFANGFCSMCGKLESDYLRPNNDGFYELTTGRDLAWFSHKVSDEKNGALNALLTTDINMAEEDNALFAGIGNTGDAAFYGTFDGQGHTIDNLKISRDSYAGLICYAKGGATVKNLILGKDCKINATNGYTGIIGGSVSGASGTVTMDRLGFEGTAIAGGPNAAGIIGVNMGSTATFVITNCYVTGTVQGARESAALTGWTGGAQSSIINCWSSATVTGNDEGKNFFRNDETVPQNCYNKTDHNNTGKLKVYTDEQLKNGELAYLLNQGDIQ